jgi:DNA helicase HerA-like ATPase
MPIQDVSEIFIPNRIARLMKMEENQQTRYQYEIWFEYTRQIMTELREGTLLAVKNFSTNQNETHYSILETVSLMPIHYALGERPEGYPGFVMEAARNIATDWTSQEDRSEEDTTIIRCAAMPTGIEIIESHGGRDLIQDQALPMIGSEVRVLTTDATRMIVNREISPTEDHVFEGGRWLVNNVVPIYIRVDDLVRVHFGIFGFTGAGKSNLVSTYIASLLRISQDRRRPVKIVLFDLMGEYTVLLLDQLLSLPQAWILAIGEHTLPGRVVEFMCGSTTERQNAINDLLSSSLYPKFLERIRSNFQPAFARLLDQEKLRIYREPILRFSSFLDAHEELLTKGNMGNSSDDMWRLKQSIRQRYSTQERSPQTAQSVINEIQNFGQSNSGLTATARNNLASFQRQLELEASQQRRNFPETASLSLENIINNLSNSQQSSLIIIQAHDPDDLRNFSNEIGWRLYEHRRRTGVIQPLVSFIFDEADEFIPQHAEGESYRQSSRIAETLARRGRKFGLGVGICTQRVANLKTNVMAQPHTYLISKMPRQYDREAIQQAFGFSEDMFRQTFKFAPGDWLLASHDATGLKAVPIPIHAQDANERIQNFLQTLSSPRVRQR